MELRGKTALISGGGGGIGRAVALAIVRAGAELKIVRAHTGWPWVEELISVSYKWDNVYFGVDAWMPKYMKPEIIHYINSRMVRTVACGAPMACHGKKVWINGKRWGPKKRPRKKLLRDNAVVLFGLS